MANRDYRYGSGPWRDSYVPYDNGQEYYNSPYHYGDRSYYRDYRGESSRRYEDERAWHDEYTPEDDRPYRSSYSDGPSTSHLYRNQPIARFSRSHSPPKEPLAMRRRDDRSVTPSPVRPPSPSYLALAEETPSLLSSATEERKLLILDLNGTLVHRAPYTRPKNKHEPPPVDKSGRPLPRLRPVHPRPYMPAFRQYLFSPETKKWLDVMIWSSAQPHSVNDMVEKCFGEEKAGLVVVWARDTLGLSAEHYSRKVQTVKDLTTPWAKLPKLIGQTRRSPIPPEASSPLRDRTSPSPVPEPESASVHSALTTLLLDDSPKKAVLQPYNHVCLPEYSAETRAQDLELLHTARRREAELQDAEARAESNPDASPQPQDAEQEPASLDSAADEENSKKRKRKEKKETKRAAKRAQRAATSGLTADAEDERRFDETLLAVVGVLDEIKMQRNVAAWIRNGGLRGPHTKPEASTAAAQSQVEASTTTSVPPPSSAEMMPTTSGNDAVSSPSADAAKDPNEEFQDANPQQSLWFEHPATREYWVTRGREALEKLEIPIVHGVER